MIRIIYICCRFEGEQKLEHLGIELRSLPLTFPLKIATRYSATNSLTGEGSSLAETLRCRSRDQYTTGRHRRRKESIEPAVAWLEKDHQ